MDSYTHMAHQIYQAICDGILGGGSTALDGRRAFTLIFGVLDSSHRRCPGLLALTFVYELSARLAPGLVPGLLHRGRLCSWIGVVIQWGVLAARGRERRP